MVREASLTSSEVDEEGAGHGGCPGAPRRLPAWNDVESILLRYAVTYMSKTNVSVRLDHRHSCTCKAFMRAQYRSGSYKPSGGEKDRRCVGHGSGTQGLILWDHEGSRRAAMADELGLAGHDDHGRSSVGF